MTDPTIADHAYAEIAARRLAGWLGSPARHVLGPTEGTREYPAPTPAEHLIVTITRDPTHFLAVAILDVADTALRCTPNAPTFVRADHDAAVDRLRKIIGHAR